MIPWPSPAKHDRPGRIRRDVHRDLPAAVVVEGLGDKFSGCPAGTWRFRQCSGTARAVGWVVIHCRASFFESRGLDPSWARSKWLVGSTWCECLDRSGGPLALRELASQVASGRLRYRETVREGLEGAPQALVDLLHGGNFGKMLVKV